MLPKKNRLQVEFFQSKKADSSKKTEFFTVKKFKPGKSISRFSVIVSKTFSKKSVLRNRLRRLVFTALRDFLNKGLVGDFILIASPKIKNLPLNLKSIKQEVEKVMKNI